MCRCTSLLMLLMLLGLQPATVRADEAETERLVLLARGRAVLRAMDCARCHGRDYGGWAAPSLLAAVREDSRERFERSVLDGNQVRGMPGYRSQSLVVAGIDAIHAYLLALATGTVASPPGAASASAAGASMDGAPFRAQGPRGQSPGIERAPVHLTDLRTEMVR